jgi:radical SAM enzyme (TIGR01210 family)
MAPSAVYPERGRSAWIVAQRPRIVRPIDPNRPQGVFLERERLANDEVVESGVVLLTNKECPWRCLMCDLWKETMLETVPVGAIPRQIDFAREQLVNLRERTHAAEASSSFWPEQLKLYNSGSFFDSAAIPFEDYEDIARRVAGVRNVVVESHPRLIGDATLRWRDLRAGEGVEVAMGLETAQPEVLQRLNKKFDLEQFARAAEFLRSAGIALRVFLLVQPPFLDQGQAVAWAVKSAEFAFDCGASAVSLIATRAGNGALERLRESGEFAEPRLAALEAAQDGALALRRGRVFADTWGTERFSSCAHCWPARRERIEAINLAQANRPRVACAVCGGR